MTYEELKALHEAYRVACTAARDTSANDGSPETQKRTQDAVLEARHALDAALIQDKADREDKEREAQVEECRRAAAKLVAGLPPVVASPFPLEAIRAYGASKKHGETLSFTMPFEKKFFGADWTTTDTTTYSSYTVPQSWQNTVYMFQIAQSGVLAAGPTILTTANGNQINYPALLTDMTSGAHGEGAAATETNPVFTTAPLNSFRCDGWTPIADELFRDSGVDIESVLRVLAARSLAIKAAPYYGDIDIGSGGGTAPHSITAHITNGKTCASQTVVTLDEAKELMCGVLRQYSANGKFVSNQTVYLAFMLAKDGNGNYIWEPSNQAGEPDRLWGKPFIQDAYFDASASGNIPLIFGDVEQAYIVRRIGGIQVDLSRDFAFTSFETTARWAMWHDAATIDNIACKGATLA